jgi:hypothetical protein
MTTTTGPDVWGEWQRLAARTVRGQVQLGRLSWDTVRQISRSRPDDLIESGRSYLDVAWQESDRYWREAAGLGLDFAGSIVALTQGSVARVLERTAPATERTAAQDGLRHVAVRLSADLGSTASAKVTVANRQKRGRRVSFEVSALTGPAGEFTVPIEIAPATALLQPDEELTVKVRLLLDPLLFVAGESYTGEVHVRGGDELILDLDVRPA